jgi:hypothetical protein
MGWRSDAKKERKGNESRWWTTLIEKNEFDSIPQATSTKRRKKENQSFMWEEENLWPWYCGEGVREGNFTSKEGAKAKWVDRKADGKDKTS